MSTRIEHVADDAVAASVGPVHLALYRGRLTMASLEAIHAAHLRVQRERGHSLVLSVARPNLPLPEGEVRKRVSALAREVEERTRAASIVIPGEGFWASAARSFLTAGLTLGASKYPSRVFNELEEGAEWLARHDLDAKVPDLVEAVATLREA